jgi:3'(2'),5'-bisphosphate nucleotidase
MAGPILDLMKRAALAAGEVILEVYDAPIAVTQKPDGSPVTTADEKAEDIILQHLSETGIPVLAEESVAAGKIPELGERFFVVDPLDGTKEFIKRNGEFTVNIALIVRGRPIAGVVTAPALHTGYVGSEAGAFSFDVRDGKAGDETAIVIAEDGPINIVASRSHGHAALTKICDNFAVEADISVGSSLKFCLVASGEAKFYPRLTPTCEWDTAAGQAVLEAAGGVVLSIDGTPLSYGKSTKKYYNPFFVAATNTKLASEVAALMRQLAL